MRKGRDGKKMEKMETSLPAVYRPNYAARTTTAGTPHTRANNSQTIQWIKHPDSKMEFFRSFSTYREIKFGYIIIQLLGNVFC